MQETREHVAAKTFMFMSTQGCLATRGFAPAESFAEYMEVRVGACKPLP